MAKKKLLSEAQVRKFMGLAKLDANMSSAFLSENWGMNEEEEEEMPPVEMGDEEVSMDAEVEMPVADLEGGEPEEADEATPDVDMDTDALQRIADALGILQTDLSPLMTAAGISAEEEVEMDAEMPPMEMEPEMDAEIPPMDMDVEAEEEVELEEDRGSKKGEYKRTGGHKSGDEDGHYKDYEMDEAKIVAEVTRRVAKRINEAARAQKKADKLLGRSKK